MGAYADVGIYQILNEDHFIRDFSIISGTIEKTKKQYNYYCYPITTSAVTHLQLYCATHGTAHVLQ